MKSVHWLTGSCMLALLACSGDKEPADGAIKAGQAAIEIAREESAKYVPEELGKLESARAGRTCRTRPDRPGTASKRRTLALL